MHFSSICTFECLAVLRQRVILTKKTKVWFGSLPETRMRHLQLEVQLHDGSYQTCRRLRLEGFRACDHLHYRRNK